MEILLKRKFVFALMDKFLVTFTLFWLRSLTSRRRELLFKLCLWNYTWFFAASIISVNNVSIISGKKSYTFSFDLCSFLLKVCVVLAKRRAIFERYWSKDGKCKSLFRIEKVYSNFYESNRSGLLLFFSVIIYILMTICCLLYNVWLGEYLGGSAGFLCYDWLSLGLFATFFLIIFTSVWYFLVSKLVNFFMFWKCWFID